MSVKLPTQLSGQGNVTTPIGNDQDEVLTQENNLGNHGKGTVVHGKKSSEDPDGISQNTASILQKHSANASRARRNPGARSPQNMSVSNNTYQNGIQNHEKLKMGVDYNIRAPGVLVENDTMLYQSGDDSMYAQQINQLGGIMLDDLSNNDVTTIQGGHYREGIVPNNNRHFAEDNSPYNNFTHCAPPKSTHTTKTRRHASNKSQHNFHGQVEFFGQRKASQKLRELNYAAGASQNSQCTESIEARSVNGKGKKVKFGGKSVMAESQQDIRDHQQYRTLHDEYQQSTKTAMTYQVNKKRRGIHRSIDFEKSGSLATQSNDTNQHRRSKNVLLQPLDPFQRPALPKVKNDYSSSELTIQNQRLKGLAEAPFVGPKIQIENALTGSSVALPDQPSHRRSTKQLSHIKEQGGVKYETPAPKEKPTAESAPKTHGKWQAVKPKEEIVKEKVNKPSIHQKKDTIQIQAEKTSESRDDLTPKVAPYQVGVPINGIKKEKKEEEFVKMTAKEPQAKVPPLELKNLNNNGNNKPMIYPQASQATKTPMGTIGSDLTKADLMYANVLKIEQPKNELEIQPNVLDYNNVEEFREEVKKGLQKDTNTEREGLKQSKQSIDRNKSKISYLLDNENIFTNSSHASATDHEVKIEILGDAQPYQQSLLDDEQAAGEKKANARHSGNNSYLADKSADSVSQRTAERKLQSLDVPDLSTDRNKTASNVLNKFETELDSAVEQQQEQQPVQVVEMPKKHPQSDDPEINAAYQWIMGGLKVQFKSLFITNRFQQALNNMSFPASVASTPKLGSNRAPNIAIEESPDIESPHQANIDHERSAKSTPQAAQDQNDGGDTIDFHSNIKVELHSAARDSSPEQEGFSELLGGLAKNYEEAIDALWKETPGSSRTCERLEKDRFKEFLNQVTKLLTSDAQPSFTDKYFEEQFDKYNAGKAGDIGKSEIADLIEEMFRDSQKCQKEESVTAKSVGVDPPSFGDHKNDSPKAVMELAVQTSEYIKSSRENTKDDFLKENSRLTCSEEPILQIHANLVDTSRNQEGSSGIQKTEIDELKENSRVLANFKKDFEHNFEIAKKRNELRPTQDLAESDGPRAESVEKDMGKSSAKDSAKRSKFKNMPKQDKLSNRSPVSQPRNAQIHSVSQGNVKYLLQNKIHDPKTQAKYLKNLQQRAFAAANQQSLSPSRHKKWAAKNKNILIGGASLEQARKKSKQQKRAPSQENNDYMSMSMDQKNDGRNKNLQTLISKSSNKNSKGTRGSERVATTVFASGKNSAQGEARHPQAQPRKPAAMDSQDSIFMRNYRKAKERNSSNHGSLENSLPGILRFQNKQNKITQNGLFLPTGSFMHVNKPEQRRSISPQRHHFKGSHIFQKEFQEHVQANHSNTSHKPHPGEQQMQSMHYSDHYEYLDNNAQPPPPLNLVLANQQMQTFDQDGQAQIHPSQFNDTVIKNGAQYGSKQVEIFQNPNLLQEDGSMRYPVASNPNTKQSNSYTDDPTQKGMLVNQGTNTYHNNIAIQQNNQASDPGVRKHSEYLPTHFQKNHMNVYNENSSISQQEVQQDSKFDNISQTQDSILSAKQIQQHNKSTSGPIEQQVSKDRLERIERMYVDRSQQYTRQSHNNQVPSQIQKPMNTTMNTLQSMQNGQDDLEHQVVITDKSIQYNSGQLNSLSQLSNNIKRNSSNNVDQVERRFVDKSVQQSNPQSEFKLPEINLSKIQQNQQVEAMFVDQSQQMTGNGQLWSKDSKKFEENMREDFKAQQENMNLEQQIQVEERYVDKSVQPTIITQQSMGRETSVTDQLDRVMALQYEQKSYYPQANQNGYIPVTLETTQYEDKSVQGGIQQQDKSIQMTQPKYVDQSIQMTNTQGIYGTNSIAQSNKQKPQMNGQKKRNLKTSQDVQRSTANKALTALPSDDGTNIIFGGVEDNDYQMPIKKQYCDQSIQLTQHHQPYYKDQSVQQSIPQQQILYKDQSQQLSQNHQAYYKDQGVQNSEIVSVAQTHQDQSVQMSHNHQPMFKDQSVQLSQFGDRPVSRQTMSDASKKLSDKSKNVSSDKSKNLQSEKSKALKHGKNIQATATIEEVQESKYVEYVDTGIQYSVVSEKPQTPEQVKEEQKEPVPSPKHYVDHSAQYGASMHNVDRSVQYSVFQHDQSPKSSVAHVLPAIDSISAQVQTMDQPLANLTAEHIVAIQNTGLSEIGQQSDAGELVARQESLRACNQVSVEEILQVAQPQAPVQVEVLEQSTGPLQHVESDVSSRDAGLTHDPTSRTHITARRSVDRVIVEGRSRLSYSKAAKKLRNADLTPVQYQDASVQAATATPVAPSEGDCSVDAKGAVVVQTENESAPENLADASIQTVLYLEAQQLKEESKASSTHVAVVAESSRVAASSHKSSAHEQPAEAEPEVTEQPEATEVISKHSKSVVQKSEMGQQSEVQVQQSEKAPTTHQSEIQEALKSEVQEGAVGEVASHISNVPSQMSNAHHSKSIKSSTPDMIDPQVQSVEPATAQHDFDEIQNELASNKTGEIQGLSKQFVQQYQEYSSNTFEAEERELLLQRQQIIQEKDKIIQQLKQMENEKKEKQLNKRQQVLEAEKENLKQDLNELDQLKELLRIMQKTKGNDQAERIQKASAALNVELAKEEQEDLLSISDVPPPRQQKGAAPKDPPRNMPMSYNYPGQHFQGYAADQECEPYNNNWLVEQNRMRKQHHKVKVADVDDGSSDPRSASEYGKATHETVDKPGSQDAAETDHGYAWYQEESEEERESVEARLIVPYEARAGHQVAAVESFAKVKNANGDLRKRAAQLEVHDADFGRQLSQQPTPSKEATSNMAQTFLSASGLYDWHQSSILQDVLDKKEKFIARDDSHYDEDEIHHLIEQVKKSHMQSSEFSKGNLQVVFKKSFQTVAVLMNLLNQKQLFEMIAKKYSKVNLENTAKLLVRCKSLLAARQLVYKTLKGLVVFEKSAKQIRQDIDKHLDSAQTDNEEVGRLQSQIGKLPILSNQIIDDIAMLRDHYRLFNAMVAITSKGNQVYNLMAYRRRDAMRYVIKEYEGIKRLAQVVDQVETMPVLTAK